jgi:pimeloyl-ACP methyl ester carboxylesterase
MNTGRRSSGPALANTYYMKKIITFLTAVASVQLALSNAWAMPEAKLQTRANGEILQAIKNGNDYLALKDKFSKTDIPELDQLWDSREDFKIGECTPQANDCRILSVFKGDVSNKPLVLLPGFTAYRKMYIEQIYDLLKKGYGPIYISDFRGTGDSFRTDIKAGLPLKNVKDVLKEEVPSEFVFDSKLNSKYGKEEAKIISPILKQIQFGRGYVENFLDYNKDVHSTIEFAVNNSGIPKVTVTSLSMSALSLMLSLADQNQNPTWIKNTDKIILQSPMLRVKSSNLASIGISGILQVFARLFSESTRLVSYFNISGEFVTKALAGFDEKNGITHSKNRITLTDSLRVWNGAETGGATFKWIFEEMKYQYARGALDIVPNVTEPLNDKTAVIAQTLESNKVDLFFVGSMGDGIVDTDASLMFLKDLKNSAKDLNITTCIFMTARHVIDQESDKYRDSYIDLLVDLKRSKNTRAIYQPTAEHEALKCYTVTANKK